MHYTSPDVYNFISKQTSDPITERKTCRISGTKFPIFQSDLNFYQKVSPVFGGKKYLIPTPTLCPEERQRRRLMFRNERNLYKRKCDATGETIISIYSPNSPQTVYNNTYWRSDARDPMQYTIENLESFSTLVDQKSMYLDVPLLSLMTIGGENAEYANHCGWNKNCYLIFYSDYNEACCYLDHSFYNTNCFDSSYTNHCTHCYGLMYSRNCYTCSYLENCDGCKYVDYSYHCHNCEHCILCSNIQNKTYCYQNKQYTKEEYEQLKQHFANLSQKEKNKLYTNIKEQTIQAASTQKQTSASYGNNLEQSKNTILSYNCWDCEDSKYIYDSAECKDCYDFSGFGSNNTSLVYESTTVGVNSSHILFCRGVFENVSHMIYCSFCIKNCHHCFGCIGLRNKSYCIFNQQYTKQEYETLVQKIIQHMQETGERGEFFDPSLSPFGYNETVAHEHFPLTRIQAIEKGYTRQDETYDPIIPKGLQTLTGNSIPSDITQVDDTILKKIFICEISNRPFRIIKQELDFYRKHNISLPKKHPDIRHQERLDKRPGRNLYLRTCDKTGKEIVSVYPQNVPFQVYSEEAYEKEVFG